ncbi:hypothetical protein EXIGLDRAFT_768430 [Exidia glandulosa HHB12029]|uniref:Uncharacterized protein n=1 Tax=Exidia glandulosa HHB12029 TaxID=1314781 RepID=A0A165I9R8_EXIGL|nr:hypothetical protein EXIGLDRAFT_768430 [Exidia glandulosa HHB12029]
MSGPASVVSLMTKIMLRIDALRAAGYTEATNVELARLAGHLASITARYQQPEAVLKVLTSPPIFDCLYDYCTARTLCCLARTCVAARQAVENYLRHALNVNKLLARFFGSLDGARAFRNLQARYEFVVSGSQALQLLDRTVYPKSDLDIYVFPLDGEAVGRWLIDQAGYEFLAVYSNEGRTFDQAVTALSRILDNSEPLESGDPDDIYGAPSVRGVLRFAKRTANSDLSVPLAKDKARLELPRQHVAHMPA